MGKLRDGQRARCGWLYAGAGEVAASHSEAGVLAKEVENTNRGILVADFGIDWRSIKERAKAEFNPFAHMLETDPDITEIWICGYTDCIGPGDAQYHKWLRTERARRVFNLLGPIARSKAKFVGPAPSAHISLQTPTAWDAPTIAPC